MVGFSMNFVLNKYLAVILTLFVALGCYAESEFVQSPAMGSSLASKSLLTDSTQVDGRVIAVGAYGNIVFSTDGVTWQQGNVPTRRLLTSVEFVNEKEGWAAGHDTLILHTSDGGRNWEIQYQDAWTGGDIPKPILDILFTDSLNGFAVGAFGLVLGTKDGGKTWSTIDTSALFDVLSDLGLEPEPNLYSIKALDDGYLLVGELGTILHFNPAGETVEETWRVIESPYEGSFFGVDVFSGEELIVYGLRGHLFHSADQGETWSEIDTGTIANINAIAKLPDGNFIAVGDAGTILLLGLQNGEGAVEKIPYPGFDHLMSVHPRGNSELLLLGTKGAQIFSIER